MNLTKIEHTNIYIRQLVGETTFNGRENPIQFQNQVKVDKYLLLAGADPKSVAGIFVYFKYGYFFSIFQQSTI